MSTQTGFVLKIFLLSGVLSLTIKFGGEYLMLKPTTMTALVIVILPSLIIGSILGWRYNQESK